MWWAAAANRRLASSSVAPIRLTGMNSAELEKLVVELEEEMFAAAEELRFEYAAKLRDEIKELRRELTASAPAAGEGGTAVSSR